MLRGPLLLLYAPLLWVWASPARPPADQPSLLKASAHIPAAQAAAPAAPSSIPDRRLNVSDFGARPDDAQDDTAAVQRALDAASRLGGGQVLFPSGRYDVSVQPTSAARPHRQALLLYSKLRLAPVTPGETVVIRLADRQGNYESVFGTAEYATPLEDVTLEGLEIDGNGQNNPVNRPSDSATNSPDFGTENSQTPRYSLRVHLGRRILLSRMRFVNQTNVNVVTFNGERVSDAEIRDSSFESVGSGTAGRVGVDFDHSSIYTNGPRMRVVGNTFRSRFGAGTPGARTAIEAHGSDQLVEGNTIDGFLAGINVVGVERARGERQVYRNNVVRNANTGLLLWSGGGGLQDVLIEHNTVSLVNQPWLDAGLVDRETRVTGISVEGSSDAAIAGLSISGNTVSFGQMQVLGPYRDQFSNGIQLWSFRAPNLSVTGLTIVDNTVTGALGAGIRSDVVIGGNRPNRIAGNSIVNPVRTTRLHFPDPVARRLRSGILVTNRSRSLEISGNTVLVKPGVKSDLQFGISAASTCESACILKSNTLGAPGVTPVNADPSWKLK